MKVITQHVSNASGRGGILAKCSEGQKTTPYNHALSIDANHGVAVGALVQHLEAKGFPGLVAAVVESIDKGEVTWEYGNGDGRRTFHL